MNQQQFPPLFLVALIFPSWSQITILKWQECYTWRSEFPQVGLACIETCLSWIIAPFLWTRALRTLSHLTFISKYHFEWIMFKKSNICLTFSALKKEFRIWFCQKFKFYFFLIIKKQRHSLLTFGSLEVNLTGSPAQDLDGQTGFSKQNHAECSTNSRSQTRPKMFPPDTSSSVFAGKHGKFLRSLTVLKTLSCWSNPHTLATLNHDLMCCGECALEVKEARLQPWCIWVTRREGEEESWAFPKLSPDTSSFWTLVQLSILFLSWCGITHLPVEAWLRKRREEAFFSGPFLTFSPAVCVVKVNPPTGFLQSWRMTVTGMLSLHVNLNKKRMWVFSKMYLKRSRLGLHT